MRVLVACEYSAIVRDAFRAKGHDAWSCDILPTEGDPAWHIQDDVLKHLDDGWDMMIAHPDCTFLTGSAEWAYKDEQTKKMNPGTLFGAARREARKEAISFVKTLWEADIEMVAVENPVGILSTEWMEPDQYIQPNEYGEDASKKTCLWLRKLPKLVPTQFFPPRLVLSPNGKSYVYRWSNQTDSGQNKLTPSESRGLDRAKFYPGWAKAMAEQWGNLDD